MTRHGWKIALALAVAFAGLARLGCRAEEEIRIPTPKDLTFVIVSFDGLRPDAIEQADAPNLRALIARGVSASGAKTILPSSTLPSHASMLTGVEPKRHRIILWNDYDPDKGLVEVPTCFELARAQGYATGLFVGKKKLWHLSRGAEVFEEPDYAAKRVARAALEHISGNPRNGLFFVHFADPDGAGHRHGWMSEEQMKAIHDADTALGTLVDGLAECGKLDRTIILVSADHGGHGKTHGTFLDDDMKIPWIMAGPGVKSGVVLDREIVTYDTAATALAALGVEVPADWDGKPVMEAFEGVAAGGK